MAEALLENQLQGYTAALEGAAYRALDEVGFIRVTGETRLEYLQRQTSNDVELLSDERAVRNVLTSSTGRVLEVFTMLPGQDEFFLLTPSGHGPGLAAYFQKRIFFNDKVEIEDQSEDWFSLELHGPRALEVAQRALSDLAQMELDQVMMGQYQGESLFAVGAPGLLDTPAILIVAPVVIRNALCNTLQAQPAEQLSAASYEALRIEAGQSGPPEWNDAYTPFEVGLSDRVSDEKGCYTGQEVLARQVTYDKITRALVRLKAASVVTPGSAIHAEDGKQVGQISSSAYSPRLGQIALAVLRRPYGEGQTRLEADNDSKRISLELLS